MKKGKFILLSFFSMMFLTNGVLTLSAEEPEQLKPDGLIVENYRGGNTFSRKVSTSVAVYSKKGTIPTVTHKSTTFNNVKVNYMEVVADGENTIIQVEYTGGKPEYMNVIYDGALTANDKYYLVGAINGGFFNNNPMSTDYGVPSGAVASNFKFAEWSNGWTLTPSHGNGFTTAYLESGKMMDHRYHGWNKGVWQPLDDKMVEYIESGIRYSLPEKYGLSGAYTLLVDGQVNHLGKEDSAYYNYNNGKSSVTLLGQKQDGTFLLVTTEGGIGNGDEETKLMQQLGAYSAYRLDGGGSTQLMYTEGLVNYHEVLVSNLDGSVSYKKAVKDGKTLNDLADPVRKNYTFMGWYTTKDGAVNLDETTKVDLTTHTFTENTNLYAGWTRNKVNVTLNIEGQKFAAESFSEGELYSPISIPSIENGWLKEKDVFVGWFKDPELTIPYSSTELLEGVTDLTLYGKVERYVLKDFTVNITTNEGGTVSPSTIKVKEGQDLTISIVPNHDYEIESVKVNGQPQALNEKGQLTIKNIQADTNVDVAFKKTKIDIVIQNADGVEIFRTKGDVGTKAELQDKDGKFIKEIVFDKNNTTIILDTPKLPDRDFYTWEISVQYNKIFIKPIYSPVYTYTVNVVIPNGGGTSTGTGPYEYGSDATITFTPDEGYEIDYVDMDGKNLGKINLLSLTNITADTTITVFFKQVVFTEGAVTINVRDVNEFNQQDLSSLSQQVKVVDDGSVTKVDLSSLLAELEARHYNIKDNQVPVEVSYANNGAVYEISVTHQTQEETGKVSDVVQRTINVTYSGVDLPAEVITQDGSKDYRGVRTIDLVTNTVINDYDIVYNFDAYKLPVKEGYSLDVTEIPAVKDGVEYTSEYTVVYTKNVIERYDFKVNFKDINAVDKQDLSSYAQKFNVEAGTVIDITENIKALENKGYVVKNNVDKTYTVNGNKEVTVELAHRIDTTEDVKDYNFTRTIKFEFSDDAKKNYDKKQTNHLKRTITTVKDAVTGKSNFETKDAWDNNESKLPAITVEKVDGYSVDKTFINAIDLKEFVPEKHKTDYEVIVKYTKLETPKPPVKPEKPQKPEGGNTDKPVVNPGSKPSDGTNNNTSNNNQSNESKPNGSLSTKPNTDIIVNKVESNKNDNNNVNKNDKNEPNKEVVNNTNVNNDVTDVTNSNSNENNEVNSNEVVENEVTETATAQKNNNLLYIGGAVLLIAGGIFLFLVFGKKDDDEDDDDDSKLL